MHILKPSLLELKECAVDEDCEFTSLIARFCPAHSLRFANYSQSITALLRLDSTGPFVERVAELDVF